MSTRATPGTSAPRGFSLLELLVGAVLALMIASVTMSVLLGVQQMQRDAQSRNAIARDAQFAVEHLGYDLQYLGVGVPRGLSADPVGEVRPALRTGLGTALAFVGDLPYPNAELNGIAVLNHIKGATTPPDTGNDDEILVTSELSPCAPEAASASTYVCDQHLIALVPIGAGAGDKCVEGNVGARLCPWGMGKWQRDAGGAVSLTFSGPRGDWQHRRWNMSNAGGQGGWDTLGEAAGPHLNHSGGGDLDRALFLSNPSGVATVAQLDRVFYSLEDVAGGACPNLGAVATNCVLLRRQCWGALGDPDSPGFPAVGGAALRSSDDPDACAPPNDGTPWETVINGVDRMTFRYFRRPGQELFAPLDAADAAELQYIEIELVITRQLTGSSATQSQVMTRRFFVENSGGFEGPGAGSCGSPASNPWCGRP